MPPKEKKPAAPGAKKPRRDNQLSFRAEAQLVERIDSLRAAMKRQLRGLQVSRSDLLKTLVEQSLPVMEMEYTSERGFTFHSPEALAAMISDTIRIMLDVGEAQGVEPDVPGYVIKKK